MTEEPTRSTPGNAPQRRPTDAPSWWAELERSDLPEGGPARRRSAPTLHSHRPRLRLNAAPMALPERHTAWGWRRALTTVLFVMTVAVALAWFGILGGNVGSLVVALLIFGIPAGLAAGVVALVARKTG